MSKTYLILLSDHYNRDWVIDLLERNTTIEFWFYNMENTLFVVTKFSAKQIYEVIEKTFGRNLIFITEVSNGNYWGSLPPDHWAQFTHKPDYV